MALVAGVGCMVLLGCDVSKTRQPSRPVVPGGDPARGRDLVARGVYGCTSCHTIPGVSSPQGVVGPPLGGMAARAFVAGELPNTPATLVAFLQDPPGLVPATGMPDVRLGLDEARDIAAYLYTLEPRRAP